MWTQLKKEEGEHTNSTLYDNWICTNAKQALSLLQQHIPLTCFVGTVPQQIGSAPRQAQMSCQFE